MNVGGSVCLTGESDQLRLFERRMGHPQGYNTLAMLPASWLDGKSIEDIIAKLLLYLTFS